MRRLLLSLSAFAVAAITLSGCCGTLVQGEVRTVDHMPIEGARVTVDESGVVRHTDAEGRYSVALHCRNDPYLVRVIADGYPETSDWLNSPGGHITRNFILGGDESQPASPREYGGAPRADPEPDYEPDYEPGAPPARRDPPRSSRRDPPAREDPPIRSQRARIPKRACPECSTEVPVGDRECPGCGAVYLSNDTPPARRATPPPARRTPPAEQPSEPVKTTKSCPACGTDIAKGDRDCSGCGATILD